MKSLMRSCRIQRGEGRRGRRRRQGEVKVSERRIGERVGRGSRRESRLFLKLFEERGVKRKKNLNLDDECIKKIDAKRNF